jgi:pimeloyl-ACP methyl ester carboxylesterase
VRTVRGEADEVVCLLEPDPMWAIGLWYENFAQVSDEQVAGLLAGGDPDHEEVRIPCGEAVELEGELRLPRSPGGVVLFAHGSGSGRHSPRNRMVAGTLNSAGFATVLFDLLTPSEAPDRERVFDIPLLAARLQAAVRWASGQPRLQSLGLGLFGASTGAAAALWAAAELGGEVRAVVSRGGRPDLALARLDAVVAPVLLIVGGADEAVLDLNRQAQAALPASAELRVIAGAGHLFEEPGALEEVANLATQWFARHLGLSRR